MEKISWKEIILKSLCNQKNIFCVPVFLSLPLALTFLYKLQKKKTSPYRKQGSSPLVLYSLLCVLFFFSDSVL